MIQKIKNHLLIALSSVMLLMPLGVPVMVGACSNSVADDVAKGASDVTQSGSVSCDGTNVGAGSLTTLAKNVVKLFSIIVGAVSIIMIIYGGFRYITSGGDSNRIGSAKNTLIYAIIGLIIVALAQLIVHFVLNQADSLTTGGGTE